MAPTKWRLALIRLEKILFYAPFNILDENMKTHIKKKIITNLPKHYITVSF